MIDGVVRAPSAFSITLATPFSSTETQELVVPRSIPIILPMFTLPKLWIWMPQQWWLTAVALKRLTYKWGPCGGFQACSLIDGETGAGALLTTTMAGRSRRPLS